MRKLTSIGTLFVCLGAAGVIAPSAASAQAGQITYLEDASVRDRPMVVAASDRGIVFIGPDATVFRGFYHDQSARPGSDQPFLWVTDLDNDGQAEYVGAGRPAFVIAANADPMWGIAAGCEQFFVGDFIDSRDIDILCRQGATVELWSFDGQEYFRWQGSGYNLDTCFAEDFSSNGKLDLACNLSNGDNLRFDFDFMEPETYPGEVDAGPQRGVDRSASQSRASGSELSLGGGRTATLDFAGGAIIVSSGGAQVASIPVSSSGIHSAVAADLDGDGTAEIYVGGDDEVYVISAEGALIGTVPANPTRYSRDARVTMRSASANGLENSDREAIAEIVEGDLPALRQCYASRMGNDQFTRVGQMLFELTVDGSGRVTNAERRHSSLRNRDVENCVSGRLNALRFSSATDGTGLVNVTLDFDFVDLP